MQKLSSMDNNLNEYSDDELKILENLIATEISKRQDIEKEEKWRNLVEAFKDYDKKYGIVFENDETGEEYIMLSADEDEYNRFYFR